MWNGELDPGTLPACPNRVSPVSDKKQGSETDLSRDVRNLRCTAAESERKDHMVDVENAIRAVAFLDCNGPLARLLIAGSLSHGG